MSHELEHELDLLDNYDFNFNPTQSQVLQTRQIQTVGHPTRTKKLWTLIPDKSVYLLVPDVVAEDEQSVLDVASSAQRVDQLAQVTLSVVHLDKIKYIRLHIKKR